ncbi:hypothetical protein L2E82_31532 [Cichorium intybus]|uniref:Uncharacterized protein n=1 Tax=Cichorium intybus TaxID=13427 RepID=A0ACB9BEA8_CICIN|nr:hypothetical protein L2E82_31532 [Cichorium intybus]
MACSSPITILSEGELAKKVWKRNEERKGRVERKNETDAESRLKNGRLGRDGATIKGHRRMWVGDIAEPDEGRGYKRCQLLLADMAAE